jgi:hypothetical protein
MLLYSLSRGLSIPFKNGVASYTIFTKWKLALAGG